MIFLYLQYSIFAFVGEIITLVAKINENGAIVQFCGRNVAWVALLAFGMKSRTHVAKLSGEDLSTFLTDDVILGGVFVGLTQLTFLMFGSIQCYGNTDEWRDCNRTLYSQAGLSFMIGTYILIKLASGVVPKQILEKHVFSLKKVVAMRMNSEEAVQAFGLSIAGMGTIYLLGNYGANGNFEHDDELHSIVNVTIIGAGCLLLTAVWKFVVIRREMSREAEGTGQQSQGGSSSDAPLVEGSSFWFYIGVLATTYFSAVNIVAAVTMDEFYEIACQSVPNYRDRYF